MKSNRVALNGETRLHRNANMSFRNTFRRFVLAVLPFVIASRLPAQHAGIPIGVAADRLFTFDETTGLPTRVFPSELDELGIPGFTQDPGYESNQLDGGERIGFNVGGGLLYWNGTIYDVPPN